MEYHASDDKTIATKVFELGLKSYADKPDYVLHYLNFLIQINDQPSTPNHISFLTIDARALFERTVSKLPAPAAKLLFDLFYTYECEYGDSAAIRKLSKRIADLYPEGIPPLSSPQSHNRIQSPKNNDPTHPLRYQPYRPTRSSPSPPSVPLPSHLHPSTTPHRR
jgi:cleavage stimulation factor subunit 3